MLDDAGDLDPPARTQTAPLDTALLGNKPPMMLAHVLALSPEAAKLLPLGVSWQVRTKLLCIRLLVQMLVQVYPHGSLSFLQASASMTLN